VSKERQGLSPKADRETPESLAKIPYVCFHIWITDILDWIAEIANVSFVFSSSAPSSMENNQE
jgi:hypothetical protein